MANNEHAFLEKKYHQLLEDFHDVSSELKQTKGTLQAEYAFAEEQLNKVKTLEAFIESDSVIKAQFMAFVDNANKEEK